MKIVMVTTRHTAPEHQQAIAQFLTDSQIDSAACQHWQLDCDNPWPDSQVVLAALSDALASQPADVVIFPGDSSSMEYATRLSTRLGGCTINQARRIIPGAELQVEKGAWGNGLYATLIPGATPCYLAVARRSLGSIAADPLPPITRQIAVDPAVPGWSLDHQIEPIIQGKGLEQATWVLAIGEGAGSAGGAQEACRLAQQLNAQPGGSRQAVMNGWLPMDSLIGMSGALVAPEVCLAAGVSGAPAFSYGISASRKVVAINTDASAAIFKQADVGIVDEMLPVLRELARLAAKSGG